MTRKFLPFLTLIILISCKEKKVDTRAEAENLMQASRDWAKTIHTDSLEKAISYWNDSAVLFSAGYEPLYGKAAIGKMVEESLKIPGFSLTWEPISASVSENGDMGYLIEKNVMTVSDSTGKAINYYGNAVTIWKKNAKGEWKNVVDVSIPAPTDTMNVNTSK